MRSVRRTSLVRRYLRLPSSACRQACYVTCAHVQSVLQGQRGLQLSKLQKATAGAGGSDQQGRYAVLLGLWRSSGRVQGSCKCTHGISDACKLLRYAQHYPVHQCFDPGERETLCNFRRMLGSRNKNGQSGSMTVPGDRMPAKHMQNAWKQIANCSWKLKRGAVSCRST